MPIQHAGEIHFEQEVRKDTRCQKSHGPTYNQAHEREAWIHRASFFEIDHLDQHSSRGEQREPKNAQIKEGGDRQQDTDQEI